MNFVEFLLEGHESSSKQLLAGADPGLSYAQLHREVESRSRSLAAAIGVGQEVLLLSDNNAFFIISYLSIMRSGNAALLIETSVGKEELAAIMGRCRPAMALVQRKYLEKVPPGLRTITDADPGLPSLESDQRAEVGPDDLAVVVFTSGSTGAKKGVMITHGNLIANTSSIIEYLRLTGRDRVLVVLPFYYCFGASLLHTHLKVGGSLFIHRGVFLGSILTEADDHECTGFAGVPSTYQILISRTDFLKHRFRALRYMAQAGGKLEPRYIQMIADSHPEIEFFVMYGATEATARMSYLPPSLVRRKLGSIGKGIPGVTLKVVDQEGRQVSPGEVGEIAAQGKSIMSGYYGDPEGTAAVLKDGWYMTGDLATVDEEGYIYIVGRSKDIIKCAGFRISPYEIENLLMTVDGVESCAVVGEPDEVLGEAVVAVIKCRGESRAAIREKALAKCRSQLQSHKMPKRVLFIEEMPLNSSTKVDKVRIRSMLERGELDG